MIARTLWIVLALVACGPRDIEVVVLPPPLDGGFPPPIPCTDESQCPPQSVCDKLSCGATVGQCRRKPVGCEPVLSPVCGCNGVNYWNDCYRLAQGVRSRVVGECAVPAGCSPGAPCPDPGASCALLLEPAASCSTAPPGVCWVAPSSCPAGDSSWESCASPSVCGGLCAAIRSGELRRRVNSCP